MNTPSYLLGPLFLILGFLICLILVVGVKAIYLFVLDKIREKSPQKPAVKKQTKPKQKPKTIEFNADDVDRIYFRKSS